jgi:metallophosphoesterase superfamily enzyme
MRVLHDWLLTAERVAVHLPSQTAVVADLHLGYAEARRRRGEAIPADAVAEQLAPLVEVLERHGLRRLIVAGDLLEDPQCDDALEQFRQWIYQHAIELVACLPGNHDSSSFSRETWQGVARRSTNVRLKCPEVGKIVRLGKWRVTHGDEALPDGAVVHGHEHPYLRWSPQNRAIRPRGIRGRIGSCLVEGPCYLAGSHRLILPAYSDEAAGVNILSERRWRAYRCYLVAEDRVLDGGEVATLRRRLMAAHRARPNVD